MAERHEKTRYKRRRSSQLDSLAGKLNQGQKNRKLASFSEVTC